MHSRHAGRFWVGTYEKSGDAAKGTLTSVPFRGLEAVRQLPGRRRLARRRRASSSSATTPARSSSGRSATIREDLERVAVDLSGHLGQEIMIRLVDARDRRLGPHQLRRLPAARHEARRPAAQAARHARRLSTHAGLGPEEAARAMTVPPGFKVTLFAGEPDVVQPIAMAIDDRGRLWVAEAYSYPRRVPDNEAKDRILIFEDTDGDGRFDTRKVFADHLNLVSGLEVGFGGVWVGAAPHLLFIPDRDGDDRPDGPPQVLLDGWGQQDTHETLNSFTWGPDGWLYGCHGVFTHSRVGKPGTPDAERTPINAGIWRYHPTRHVFEVFAHGTSNPWGIDFDANGQMFITACVIPHLYHMIQGGRYERQAGQHFNPYTYDDIKTIADHRHYLGANPHGGNGRSDSAGGGHAHSGAMIYLGGAWPAEYQGSLFMNNIHGARLNRDILKPSGSGFVGSHAPDFLLANDLWSQIISLKYGPDGSVFMIDWYDKNQCHHNDVNGHDRTNGRVFKVSFGETKSGPQRPRSKSSSHALVQMQTSPNEWHARHARRILQERGPSAEVSAMLEALGASTVGQPAIQLRILLAQHAVGGLSDRADDRAQALGPRGGDTGLDDSVGDRARAAGRADPCPGSPSWREPIPRRSSGSIWPSALQRLPLRERWDIVARPGRPCRGRRRP